ncbi:MAG: tetratricopeptide repeat protein [Candidatus Eisenbacteria bacterium]|uniref:Tetratricopeptide repeat protein n=1 Tax=Eiseniibacteriota bacterium TaxID=2212470 RepID=A0A948S0P2_UNCEI|nr:tetratricopeptide repeat protein [Candidatus Eisenbacteria bacterium]
MELDVLAVEDAARFLLERTARGRRRLPSDPADAEALARELDGLALALEQAGAYIARQRSSLSEYLAAWRSHDQAVQEWYDPQLMKYPRSVAMTWQTTMEQLGVTEVALLRLLAWFAPDPIPRFLLEDDVTETILRDAVKLPCPGERQPKRRSPVARSALTALADYNMVRWDAEEQSTSLHRVMQEVLRNQMPGAERREWVVLALRWLDHVAPDSPGDVRTWPRWNPLRPHVAAVVGQADELAISEPTSTLMNRLAVLLFHKALHSEAEPLMRRALAIDEQSFGPEHPDVAIALNNLAQLLQATNRLGEAEPLMRRALAIDEQSFGPEHPKVAIRLNNLASLLQDTNRLVEAEPLKRRALAIDEQSFGPEHPDVAIDLNNLAQLLQATNRLGEAEPLMRRVVEIMERSFGAGHPNVAVALNNLAQLLQATNRLGEAEPLSRRQLIIFIRFAERTGHEHPNFRTALSNYIEVLKQMGTSESEIGRRISTLLKEHDLGWE